MQRRALRPARERLVAERLARGQVHDRLVERGDRPVGQHAIQRAAGRGGVERVVGDQDRVAGDRAVDPDGVLARGLGGLDGDVGVLQQIGGGHRRALAVEADAEAHADLQAQVADDVRRVAHGSQEARGQLLGDALALAARQVLEQERELVAALAGQQVLGPDDGAQAVGDDAQQRVAGLMAPLLVDAAEVVDVDLQQRQLGLVHARAMHRGAQLVVQRRAVGQAGERVVVGELVQPRVLAHAVGDVALGAQPADELARRRRARARSRPRSRTACRRRGSSAA